ncbi:unnamed protein product [Penicillium olsonii]|uniref:Major facilitator superfamily (MFS) profile domain-containing protein n=1 Tax=Penicillium olsonii TaxID=99116 RepID=A0A9W4MTS0_PENOL|nr:unnamed protein product [Penicillium olsonii]CAG8135848.1 unnamed protein product [Penicillium olsonii]
MESDAPGLSLQLSSTAHPARGRQRMVEIFIALSLVLFTSGIDQTAIATAIPTISAELGSSTGYVWIGVSFLLGSAATPNLWVGLSDIWGRKPVLLAAVFVMFVGALLNGFAPSMPILLFGRTLSGIGNGGAVQLITVVISDIFSMRQRGVFMGTLEGVYVIASAVGPLIGGAFAEKVTWRWTFWINLPCCGLAFILILCLMDVHHSKTDIMTGLRMMDWLGAAAIVGMTSLLLVGLNLGGAFAPWGSASVVCLLVSGTLVAFLFVYIEARHAKRPILPLKILQSRSVLACMVLIISQNMVTMGLQYYLPLYFQATNEATALQSGLLILPFAIAESISAVAVGFFIEWKGGYHTVLWIGSILLVLGAGLCILFDDSTSVARIIGYQVPSGIASGLLFFSSLIALQSEVSQADTAAATATFGFARYLAMAVSVVLGGVIFQNRIDTVISKKTELTESLRQQFDGAHVTANLPAIAQIQDPQQRLIVEQVFAHSLRPVWIFYASVAGCGLISVFWISRNRLSTEHTETTTGLKPDEADQPGNPGGIA